MGIYQFSTQHEIPVLVGKNSLPHKIFTRCLRVTRNLVMAPWVSVHSYIGESALHPNLARTG